MMLFFIRIPLTVLYVFWLAKLTIRTPEVSGGEMVMLLAYGLLGGVVLAVLWAPVVGDKLSAPLTSTITQETSLPPHTNRLVNLIQRLQWRGYHRLALVLVLLEGMRHPDLPQAALLGLRSSRRGSILEKWFAQEVYKYNNIQNCLHAYRVLTERHHTIPPLHRQPEVNLAILNLTREPPPEPAKLQLPPKAAAANPPRNQRIRLFEHAESKSPEETA